MLRRNNARVTPRICLCWRPVPGAKHNNYCLPTDISPTLATRRNRFDMGAPAARPGSPDRAPGSRACRQSSPCTQGLVLVRERRIPSRVAPAASAKTAALLVSLVRFSRRRIDPYRARRSKTRRSTTGDRRLYGSRSPVRLGNPGPWRSRPDKRRGESAAASIRRSTSQPGCFRPRSGLAPLVPGIQLHLVGLHPAGARTRTAPFTCRRRPSSPGPYLPLTVISASSPQLTLLALSELSHLANVDCAGISTCSGLSAGLPQVPAHVVNRRAHGVRRRRD